MSRLAFINKINWRQNDAAANALTLLRRMGVILPLTVLLPHALPELFVIHWLRFTHLSLSHTFFLSLSLFVFHRLCNFFSYRFSSYICLAFGSSIKSNQLLVGLPRPLFSWFYNLLLHPSPFLLMFRLLFPVAFSLTMHPSEAEPATAHKKKRGRQRQRVGVGESERKHRAKFLGNC